MAGKPQYKPIKDLIETRNIEFNGIFDFYGLRTALAKDLGIYYSKFKVNVEKCNLFTGKEIYSLARIIGVEGKVLASLWLEQMEKDIVEKDKTKSKRAK